MNQAALVFTILLLGSVTLLIMSSIRLSEVLMLNKLLYRDTVINRATQLQINITINLFKYSGGFANKKGAKALLESYNKDKYTPIPIELWDKYKESPNNLWKNNLIIWLTLLSISIIASIVLSILLFKSSKSKKSK